MLIDVLLATACKGGVENIIKMMIEDLEGPDMHFRVVQLVWEGKAWLSESVPYYPLLKGKGDYSLDTFVDAYDDFLIRQGVPDMVLATVWPYTVFVARTAIDRHKNPNHRTKVISWMHHGIDEYKRSYDNIDEWLSLADGHLAINAYNFSTLFNSFFPKPVYRINNPVNMPNKSMRIREYKKKDTVNIGFIGRLTTQKNLSLLLRALTENKRSTLTVVGAGEGDDYERNLYELASALNLNDRIKWLGWQTDPWMYMEEVDVVCMPSIYEGFPLTALESLAHGIPVIASRVDGIEELIENGKNGYIFDVNDLEQLTRIIHRYETGEYGNIDPEVCRRAVIKYERHTALRDMNVKLKAIYLDEKLIPNTPSDPWFTNKNMQEVKMSCDEKPLVSVVISCYNQQDYIGDAIDSVIKQDYPNIEIIITDDGSTDLSRDRIVNKVKQWDDQGRVKLFLNEENTSFNCIEKAYSSASGKYIAGIGGDDMMKPGRIRKQVDFLESNQDKYGLCFTWIECVGDNEIKNLRFENIFNISEMKHEELKRKMFFVGNCLNAPSFMMRRDLFEVFGGFDFSLRQTQDYILWLNYLLKHEIAIIPEKLTKYRVADGSLSDTATNPDSRVRDVEERLNAIFGIFIDMTDEVFESNFLNKESESNSELDIMCNKFLLFYKIAQEQGDLFSGLIANRLYFYYMREKGFTKLLNEKYGISRKQMYDFEVNYTFSSYTFQCDKENKLYKSALDNHRFSLDNLNRSNAEMINDLLDIIDGVDDTPVTTDHIVALYDFCKEKQDGMEDFENMIHELRINGRFT